MTDLPLLHFRRDPLTSVEVIGLLQDHLKDMRAVSPPESVHALDLDGLRAPSLAFWSVWHGEQLAGCCALKQLGPLDGELKSMRLQKHLRGRGLGRLLVDHLEREARRRGHRRLWLETGSQPFFAPARRLYESCGFIACPPFGSYRADPNSCFMTKVLAP